MITAIQWVRKGAAARIPEKCDIDDKEYERISKLTAEHLDDAREDLKEAEAMAVDTAKEASNTEEPQDELAEYNLDSYDDDVDDNQKEKLIFSNTKDLAYHENNEEDPYITAADNVDEEEENKELEILPTDNLLLTARTDDEISHIEAHVFVEEDDNIYVHHDIMLPSMPLCLEWLDFHTGAKLGQNTSGNYVAIGTFEPTIEIWDIDKVDVAFPDAILGTTEKNKKRKKVANDNYHVDAVMGLSWNKLHRNFLLSSSADGTVKLWDLSTSTCAQSYTHHKDKVQSVSWNPTEATVFLTGAYDKYACVLDARSPKQVTKWKLESDVESIRWDPHSPTNFYVAMESGMIQYYDVRNASNGKGGNALFNLHAHDDAVSAMDVNPLIPGCLVTGSTDKAIKVWNTIDNKPSMVTSRNFDLGRIFAAQFCPDSPFQLGLAGSKGKLHVWDMSSNAGVRNAFKNIQALQGPAPEKEKEPVTLPDDDDEDEEDEEDERFVDGALADDRSESGSGSEMED